MTKKLVYGLIFSLIALTIAGIVIGIVVLNSQSSFSKEIELTQDGATQENLSINIEGVYPTKSVEYSVKFGSKATKSYDVELSFEQSGETDMAQYLELSIVLNGDTVESGNLQEYLSGKVVALDLAMQKSEPAVLILRYTMPSEVGNEAQNLSVDFIVNITANPEN